MEFIPVKEFANLFRSIHDENADTRFCFILGAGASRNSGIKTGGQLAKEWYDEIVSYKYFKKENVDQWQKEIQLHEDRLDEFYGEIYKKRFSLNADQGYQRLTAAIRHAEPSFGYSVLSQLLTNTRHKVVVTTNFDSLTETALFTFSNNKPLVVGHESLAAFAKPSVGQPLVAKIHRDLLYAPFNKPEEIDKLTAQWSKALEAIFKTHIPIVIGYGGNDGSLMEYLEKHIDPCGTLYWCLYDKGEPREAIKRVVEKHNGHFVRYDGFDELMFDLMEVMDYKLLDKELNDANKRRVDKYMQEVEEIKEKKQQSADPKDKEAAARLADKAQTKNWIWWFLRVLAAKSVDEKDTLYLEGIKATNDSSLMNYYATFLKDILQDYDGAELYYKKALELDQNNAYNNGNYAFFLNDTRQDYDGAERYYKKGLELDPNNATINGNYAVLLQTIRKDYSKSEWHYKKALEISPHYVNFNINYATLLANIRQDYIVAEQYYKNARELAPDNTHNNGNYAQMLLALGRKDEATPLLAKAFEHCKKDDLLLELWYYRYAHYPEYIMEAKQKVEELLARGVRSPGWELQPNIERAIADGHPEPSELKRLAKAISEVGGKAK